MFCSNANLEHQQTQAKILPEVEDRAAISTLPPELRKSVDLVGRKGILIEIDLAFEKSNRVALVGVGGIGSVSIDQKSA